MEYSEVLRPCTALRITCVWTWVHAAHATRLKIGLRVLRGKASMLEDIEYGGLTGSLIWESHSMLHPWSLRFACTGTALPCVSVSEYILS